MEKRIFGAIRCEGFVPSKSAVKRLARRIERWLSREIPGSDGPSQFRLGVERGESEFMFVGGLQVGLGDRNIFVWGSGKDLSSLLSQCLRGVEQQLHPVHH